MVLNPENYAHNLKIKSALGFVLGECREQAYLTQEDMGRLLLVSRQDVNDIENGNGNAALWLYFRYIEVLRSNGIKIDWFELNRQAEQRINSM